MSNQFEGLSANQTKLAEYTLSQLQNIRSKGKEAAKNIEQFKEAMNRASSFSELHAVNDDLMNFGDDLIKKVFPNGKSFPDQQTFAELSRVLKDDKELIAILEAINYVNTFHSETIGNKERLSLAEIKKELSPEEYKQLEQCIKNIQSLAPKAKDVSEKITQFKQELEDARSLDEIQSIETNIANYHLVLNEEFQKTIQFPKNEKIAGALIDYLEMNFHVSDMMKSFNVHGQLQDDILYAESRLSNSPSIQA